MLVKLPKVCILLAAYNGEKFILEQIETICSQINIDFDIYISLDLSADNTFNLLKNLALNNNQIHLLDYGNKFGSAGANFFNLIINVDFSSYDYVSFSDQDDIWLDDKVDRAINIINENNADAYSSNVTAFWTSGKEKLIVKSYPQVRYDYLFESPGPGCTFVLKSCLAEDIKNDLILKESSIKNLWLHDWYCYSFARFHDYNWHIDSKSMMLYRQHDSNEVGANSGIKSLITRLALIIEGKAFERVLSQAEFIGQTDLLPIQLLRSKSRISMLRLMIMSFSCRRQLSHKLMMLLSCVIFSVKGCKYDVSD